MIELLARRWLGEVGPAIGRDPIRQILRRIEGLGRHGLAAPKARIGELQAEIGADYRASSLTG